MTASSQSKAEKLLVTDYLESTYYYDPTSPSGLRFKRNVTTLNDNVVLKYANDPVGTLMNCRGRSYWQTTIKRHPVRVHRIVAKLMLPEYSEELLVNHIDGNGLNNLVYNLEMVTHKGNSNRMLCHSGEKLMASNTSGVNSISFIALLNGSGTKYNNYVEVSCMVDGIKLRKKFRYRTEEEKAMGVVLALEWRKKNLELAVAEGKAFYRCL